MGMDKWHWHTTCLWKISLGNSWKMSNIQLFQHEVSSRTVHTFVCNTLSLSVEIILTHPSCDFSKTDCGVFSQVWPAVDKTCMSLVTPHKVSPKWSSWAVFNSPRLILFMALLCLLIFFTMASFSSTSKASWIHTQTLQKTFVHFTPHEHTHTQ